MRGKIIECPGCRRKQKVTIIPDNLIFIDFQDNIQLKNRNIKDTFSIDDYINFQCPTYICHAWIRSPIRLSGKKLFALVAREIY